MKKELVIISNESICKKDYSFYCDNIDGKSIPEGLSENFNVLMIGRRSRVQRSHKINLKKIIAASNILTFLYTIFKSFKKNENKYFLISITPYTFFAYIFLFICGKKPHVYLRSNGYEEYKCKFGFIGLIIYHIMFIIVSRKANLIVCRTHLLRGKHGHIVSPSQLSEKWFTLYQNPYLKKISLLYVGRIKIEKGIFSLLKIFKKLNIDANLTIITNGYNFEKNKINQKNVKILNFDNENDSIINEYDKHNIFILPSFTESHPQVLDEALSRKRPVIIFDEIKHVLQERKGVFISKRNSVSLLETINFIIKNYLTIQKDIEKNYLPTKKKFISELVNILS
jgi:glycosyltransferase involved in cell wall biosynthesis